MHHLKLIGSRLVRSQHTLLVVLLLLPVLIGLQSYYNSVHYKGASCRQYSNYQVFKYAHFHLLGDQDLYSYHPAEHCFTFKYSPAFALVFGAFAYLPDWMGLVLWMLVSGIVTFLALRALPGVAPPKQLLFLLLVGFEWFGAVQGQQTNAMIAMLLLLAFSFLERDKPLPATLLIVVTGFIKIFGFAAIVLYLFYPHKLRLALYSLGWAVLLAILPLLVMRPDELWTIYGNWYGQVMGDYGFKGMSVYSFVETWSGWSPPKQLLAGASLLAMLLPLFRVDRWQELVFRKTMLAAILIWVVIFNHKAESQTYVIAMVGIAFWYFSMPRRWWDTALILLAFLGISVIFSDLVPRSFRDEVAFAYHLKALPATILWIRVLGDLYRNRFSNGD